MSPWMLEGRRLLWLGLAAGLLSLFPLAGLLTQVSEQGTWPLCFFRALTGMSCPFCGLTRAFASAWQGRWEEAFSLNPGWPLAAILVLLFSFILIVDSVRDGAMAPRLLRRLEANRASWVFGFLMFGICRLLMD